jgi:beta-glucanase (GH16 family)
MFNMFNLFKTALLALTLSLFTLPSCGRKAENADGMFVPEGYELYWSDEFDGTELNTENWTLEEGSHGWGNNELQCYTARKENARVEDGRLVMTAIKEDYNGAPVTSARLITKHKVTFKYGYVVASVKLPKTADGLWPAFWMMGDDIDELGWPRCGEIDIFEMGHADGIKAGVQDRFLNGACHFSNQELGGHKYYAYNTTYPYALQDGEFHTFTCVWDETSVKMYIDREKNPEVEPYYQMTLENNYRDNEFRKENFILLNLAVGGNFPAIWDIEKVSGLSEGKAVMEVDYVRVFTKKK